jgi:hypothetical protein
MNACIPEYPLKELSIFASFIPLDQKIGGSSPLNVSFVCRVARFFLAKYTKTGRMYQMATKYVYQVAVKYLVAVKY